MMIPNYDVGDDAASNFKQLYDFMPNQCFRMLVCGPSGSGKTNTLMHMIYNLLYFDKVYLYAKNLEQSKYQNLMDIFQPISNEAGYDVIVMITKLHIVKLSFNSIQMDKLERLLFKSDITDPVTTILL